MPEKEKRGSTSLALKAGFWYVLSNFLIKGIAFITTPIFSRLMSEAQYGEFSNFASWQSTLLIISGAELYSTLNRAYYDHTDCYNDYVSTITFLGCGFTVALYLAFLLCKDAILRLVAIPPQYIHVLFLCLFFLVCKQTFMEREKTLYRYKSVAVLSMSSLVIPTVIATVLVATSPESQRLGARIYGIGIPTAAIGAFCAASIFKQSRRFNWSQCKYAVKLAIPLLVHYLTTYLLTSSNTIVTKSVLSAEIAAMVSITTSAVHILTILLQAVSGAVTVWLMDNLKQENYTALRRNLLIYVAGISAVAISVILVGPELIWILGDTKYAQAATLLPGMVAAVTIQSITTVFTIILTYKKRVVGTAVFTGITAVVAVVAKVLLLPAYGVQILPWINIAAFGLLFFCNYVLVCKHGYSNVINVKGFCGCVLLICLVVLVANWLYGQLMIRYGLIALAAVMVLIVVYIKRELVMNLLKKKLHKE